MNQNSHICDALRAEANNTEIFEQAKEYAIEYMAGVTDRSVIPSEKSIENLKIFNETLSENRAEPQEILKLLHEYGSPATMAQTGGRYFGFVNGGAVPVSLASKWLSDVWDQNAAMYSTSPIASTLENVCEKWIVDLLNLPEGTAAGFVTGSSAATICGITAARNYLLKKSGYDVAKKGLFGAPPIRVVLSEEAHSTVFKALSILGLGSERIEKIPSDSQGRIDHTKIPELDANTLLILQAGNVNTGAFDNFDLICKKASDSGAWIHIDGAFGLWAAASDRFDKLTSSIALADSWSADAHKTLNAPYDCGIILCRDRSILADALQMEGAYIIYSESRDNMLYTPDMSKRARGIELWATLKRLGKSGVQQLVDDLNDKAVYFAKKLSENGFQILNDIYFNQVNVYIGDEVSTQKVLSNLQKSGTCWCGGSKRAGKSFIRISVCSYRTTFDDIDKSVQAFVDSRNQVINQ